MNAPDPIENVRVPEGVPPVSMVEDEKLKNAATFKLMREDHTLGNLVRMSLLRDEHVRFAGYQIPHPLDKDVYIKVQADSSSTPCDAMLRAVGDLKIEMKSLKDGFQELIDAERERQEHEYA